MSALGAPVCARVTADCSGCSCPSRDLPGGLGDRLTWVENRPWAARPGSARQAIEQTKPRCDDEIDEPIPRLARRRSPTRHQFGAAYGNVHSMLHPLRLLGLAVEIWLWVLDPLAPLPVSIVRRRSWAGRHPGSQRRGARAARQQRPDMSDTAEKVDQHNSREILCLDGDILRNNIPLSPPCLKHDCVNLALILSAATFSTVSPLPVVRNRSRLRRARFL